MIDQKTIAGVSLIDITTVLRKSFKADKMERFFEVKEDYTFYGTTISLNKDNSIMMNFRGGRDEFSYKMIFILELFTIKSDTFRSKVITDIQKLSESGIDKIVIWTIERPETDTLFLLKKFNANLLHFEEKEIESVNVISNFFPIENTTDYNYAVIVNQISNLLVKRLQKLFHIVLSEIAAPSYDKDYGKDANIGTKSIMEFEERVIDSLVRRSYNKSKLIAVDVGCGTGRHSFNICKEYGKVYGFDFSPRMIGRANEVKKERGIDNIIFSIADLEYEEIVYEDEFRGKVDFIIASFGMGSFIEDTAKIFRRYYQWLRPGGQIIISFYNKNSIILQITPNWRDTSLAAHIDKENNTLQVSLSEDIIFQIFCKPYDENVLSLAKGLFNVEQIYTYPTTMALLPNSLLKNKKALGIFSKIDEQIASDRNYDSGHYVLLVANKPEGQELSAFSRALKELKDKKIKAYEIIEHDAVLSVDDIKKELKLDIPDNMIKTIIFKDKKYHRYVFVSLPSNKKVNTGKVLEFINRNKKFAKEKPVNSINFKFAIERDVFKLGFEIGGISPLGYNKDDSTIHILDSSILKQKGNLYMGVGDNRKTLKISVAEFTKLAKSYEQLDL